MGRNQPDLDKQRSERGLMLALHGRRVRYAEYNPRGRGLFTGAGSGEGKGVPKTGWRRSRMRAGTRLGGG